MMLMWAGAASLAVVIALVYFLRRHEDILRLRAQVLNMRFTLDTLLRRHRELAEVWCSLCEERDLLTDHIRLVRRKLSERVADDGRLRQERELAALIREAYALFLERLTDKGPHQEFFGQYFASLTRLEKEVGDAIELYNDSTAVYNRGLRGVTGFLFRRWERLVPQPDLPVPDDPFRKRRLPASVEKAESVPPRSRPVALGSESRS